MEQTEIKRLRDEYTRRDKSGLLEIYRYSNPAFLFYMQEREWEILRLLRSEKIGLDGLSVLEVGCGTGHILHRFLEFGVGSATGIDLMESRIRSGKEKYSNIRFAVGNAARLPYKSDRFDLVMQFMCLSSVLDPLMRRHIVDEMWRVVRPGGVVLSYDIRPFPFIVGFFTVPYYAVRKVLRFLMPCSKKVPDEPSNTLPPTPIKPITLTEAKKMFSQGLVRYSSLSLDFNLCKIAGKSFSLALLISHMPLLRTHYLVLARKPS